MPTQLGNKKNPIARKDHVCSYCSQKIAKGEKYEKASYTDDGTAYTWKNHIHCNQLAHHFDMFGRYDEGLTEEDFQEYIWCIYQDYNRDEKWDWKNFPKMIDFCIELMNKQKQLKNETKS